MKVDAIGRLGCLVIHCCLGKNPGILNTASLIILSIYNKTFKSISEQFFHRQIFFSILFTVVLGTGTLNFALALKTYQSDVLLSINVRHQKQWLSSEVKIILLLLCDALLLQYT